MNSPKYKLIDTDNFSARLRARAVDTVNRRLLITNFFNTEQEKDLSEPPNCDGFGRIRHFRRQTSEGWPMNSLPIDPACQSLGLQRLSILRAQAFQNAVCNWRCWYCFVPFDLLSANSKYSAWISPGALLDLYLNQHERPHVIDLTGGHPDLVPEWVVWMMEEILSRGLEQEIYLWSDDNLSNDYFWRYLSSHQQEVVATYQNYGRVCCFKGFNDESFSFNTLADPSLFSRQFELIDRFIKIGMDIYAYATFTTPSGEGIADDMRRFVDRLQWLDESLPLRTIPLEVTIFTPVNRRLNETKKLALKHQQIAIDAWQKEITDRFPSSCIDKAVENISAVVLHSRRRN
jgi:uncharacterized Fe-S cluster-containing radical SAM superfamily protein